MKTTLKSMDTTLKVTPFIQKLAPEWYDNKLAEIAMLRLDVVHPVISGNKYYKLKENIRKCKAIGKSSLLTFGGGYSNHLIATAAMAQEAGLDSIGIIRGVYNELTPTLKDCEGYGMKLYHIPIAEYRKKEDKGWLDRLAEDHGHPYIIPEGGANKEGRAGVADIARYIPPGYNHIAVSVGTGTTLAGIVNSTHVLVSGFAPMKKGSYIADDVMEYINDKRIDNYKVYDEWHYGGFGKYNDELLNFMNDFYYVNDIPLDVVYTSKMMCGVIQLVRDGRFSKTDKLLCIHTGGLQGNVSVRDKLVF